MDLLQNFKELISLPLKLFYKVEKEGKLPNSYEVSIALIWEPHKAIAW